MLGAALFIEERPFAAIGIAFERQRAIGQVREQDRRDAEVIIDHIPLGEVRLRIEDLIEIGKGETLYLGEGHNWRGLLPPAPGTPGEGWGGGRFIARSKGLYCARRAPTLTLPRGTGRGN